MKRPIRNERRAEGDAGKEQGPAGAEARKELAALAAGDEGIPFGPLFFLRHLRGLIRDRCPEPGESQPTVEFHLLDGEILNVCHVMGIAPRWVALAVSEVDRPMGSPTMRTELLPYSTIARVTIRSLSREEGHHIGFDTGREPTVLHRMAAQNEMSPEEALRAVESPPEPPASPAPPAPRRPVASSRGRTRR